MLIVINGAERENFFCFFTVGKFILYRVGVRSLGHPARGLSFGTVLNLTGIEWHSDNNSITSHTDQKDIGRHREEISPIRVLLLALKLLSAVYYSFPFTDLTKL